MLTGGGETGGETLGAALSTSTSSFEALDPHDPHLNHLAGTKTQALISNSFESHYHLANHFDQAFHQESPSLLFFTL